MENNTGAGKVWTVPNALTLLRFLLVGMMAVLFLNGEPVWAMGVYLFAAATDLVDGYIARKYNQITNLGKVMDPIADKLMTVTALICIFLTYRELPPALLIVIIAKEALMIAGGILIYFVFKKVVYSNLFGKIAAAWYFFAIMLLFLHRYVSPWDVYAVYLAVAMNIASMIQYGYINIIKECRGKRGGSGAPPA